MCQTLFFVPNEIAGIPVFGFGLLLGIWGLVSVGVLIWLARRQAGGADTWSCLAILLAVAAVIAWLLPALCKPQGLPIRGYGVMMLVAVVAGTALAAWRARRVGQDPEMVFSLVFWLFVFGMVGARTLFVIEYWHDDYWPVYGRSGPAAFVGALLNVAEGGLVIYGGLIGATVGMILFVRKHRLPLLAVADLIAPSLLLGLALGRIGCLLNGCCFGGLCDYDWAVTFPAGSPPYQAQVFRGQLYGFTLPDDQESAPVVQSVAPDSPAGRAGLQSGDALREINGTPVDKTGVVNWLLQNPQQQQKVVLGLQHRPPVSFPVARRSLPVHPTQVYSMINAFVLCLLLLAYDPFRRRDGELFALMLTIYPITRFLLEIIRTDEPAIFGTGLTISQNISLLMLAFAAGLWFYILWRRPGKAFG